MLEIVAVSVTFKVVTLNKFDKLIVPAFTDVAVTFVKFNVLPVMMLLTVIYGETIFDEIITFVMLTVFPLSKLLTVTLCTVRVLERLMEFVVMWFAVKLVNVSAVFKLTVLAVTMSAVRLFTVRFCDKVTEFVVMLLAIRLFDTVTLAPYILEE